MKSAAAYIVAIAGGSGSGKTTFAKKILESFGNKACAILGQDSYYIDQSHRFAGDGTVNFDHPQSLDFKLLAQHLGLLREGQSVDIPIYDFATHKRSKEVEHLNSHPLILVDGTLILHAPELKDSFDLEIFIDVAEDVRFSRRLQRDVKERGRTPEGVKVQFQEHVAPMHNQFVQPSSTKADIVVHVDDFNKKVDEVIELLQKKRP